jgi:hypothetical protein
VRTRCLFFLLLVGFAQSLVADEKQQTKTRNYLISFEPEFAYYTAGAGVLFGYSLGGRTSVVLRGSFYHFGHFGEGALYGGVGIGGRFSLKSNAFQTGWYLQPLVDVGFGHHMQTTERGFLVFPQVQLGYGWFFESGFALSLSGGLGYVFHSNSSFGPALGFSGILPLLQASLGYSW